MSLRAAWIFFFVIAVSALDLSDSTRYEFRAFKPGEKGSSHDTLELRASYDVGDSTDTVSLIGLFASNPGNDEKFSSLCAISGLGSAKFSEKTKYEISGELVDPTDGTAKLEVVWNNKFDGYCRTYTCMVATEDVNNEMHFNNKTIIVGPYPGTSCGNDEGNEGKAETTEKQGEHSLPNKAGDQQKQPGTSEKLGEHLSHTEIPKNIQDAFPGIKQEQQQQILDKILSIDNNTYDVSSIYEGRVYIATMNDTNFELHKMNELCKSSGGYLVELDYPEEQYFVRDFLKSLGSYRYFIGANDVDSEGNFVYYNSKKPVTNVVWSKGEPNNGGGNESCVEVLKKGLNDQNCNKKRGYICEIPLVD